MKLKNENILEAAKSRFSPLIYKHKQVKESDIQLLLTGASMSASAYNAQPWRYIYGHKGTETYSKLFSLLSEYNQRWAFTAPLLMLTIANTFNAEKGIFNEYALHDLGLSVSIMSAHAPHLGLQLHLMGGFDKERTIELCHLPEHHVPCTILTIGYPDDPGLLSGHFYERANSKRIRKSVYEFSGDITLFNRT